MHVADIEYTHDGTTMVGQLAVDDSRSGRRPAVLVSHDAGGLDDHARHSAHELAALGYVAFALDYYGGGERLAPEQIGARFGALAGDVPRIRSLARAGLDVLVGNEYADPGRVAAIGYCFGGTLSLELARSGALLSAVVGFHSGLSTPRPEDAAAITGKVLVCIGADDPIIPPDQRRAFEDEMRAGGVDWQMHLYGGAVHSFTNPAADGSNPAIRSTSAPTNDRGEPCGISSPRCSDRPGGAVGAAGRCSRRGREAGGGPVLPGVARACLLRSMVPTRAARNVRRPWSAMAAAGTAAHHSFELAEGVGLVWQPELGLPAAGALWAGQITAWAALAARGGRRWDKLLAVWSGASLGGVLVHFLLWPWQSTSLGIPALTEAEGIRASRLPLYNAILHLWALASVVSIAKEIPPPDRKWALVGLASLPVLVASARHHFTWIQEQASSHPAWWNRGARRD